MMNAKNISNKIVNFGETIILPGESKTIPAEFERNPVIAYYYLNGILRVDGEPSVPVKTTEEIKAEKEAAAERALAAEEAIRQQRLASLDGISDEGLASLADELGINPASCKDTADILKKVKAALKK